MTVTVNVRTRAVGATVKAGEVETEVPAHSNKDFFVEGKFDLTITEATPAADPVAEPESGSEGDSNEDEGDTTFQAYGKKPKKPSKDY